MAEKIIFQGTQEEFEQEIRRQLADYFSLTGKTVTDLRIEYADCCLADGMFESKKLITPDLMNADDVLFGGLVSIFFDLTMGMVAKCYGACEVTPTLNMNVNYEYSVHAGDVMHFRAYPDRLGRNICYTSAKAWVEGKEDTVCYSATGIYMLKRGLVHVTRNTSAKQK